MPELPEVETTRRGIERHLKHQAITQVIIRRPKLRWDIPMEIMEVLIGQEFSSISRRAKYLLLKCPNGTLIIHLGMSGRLCILHSNSAVQKHDHVDIILDNNTMLRYTDPRRFGAILWTTTDPLSHPLLMHLGPEPLDKTFDGGHLFKHTRSRSIAIKTLLMDSKLVVGVGNIYANEALFVAGIHPLRAANTLIAEECEQLTIVIKTILKKAIAAGGTTLKDFRSAEGKAGYFKQELLVYGREGESCTRCSCVLKKIIINGRASVYCSKCQN